MGRRSEIESALVSRVHAISPTVEITDSEYLMGLRTALTEALEYALVAIRVGEERAPAIPTPLLNQARMAARYGVALDTVLRRYLAGYSLLTEFVLQEAEDGGLLWDASLHSLLRGQASIFDRLIDAVSEEYARESDTHSLSAKERRAQRIERLLAGEMLDTSGLNYNFKAHHLGVIAQGADAEEAVRELATPLGCRLLTTHRDDGDVWAWLGSQHPLGCALLERIPGARLPPQVVLAIGEPGEGLEGWRLTHQQARAALSIAKRSPESVIRYADVALIASVLKDELLITSLRRLYLMPLEGQRDGGKALRETLRGYFASGRNISSTAAAMGLSRRTVTIRLRAVEQILGRPLQSIAANVEAALRLHELDA